MSLIFFPKCDNCLTPLPAEPLCCGSCKTSGYCSRECQAAHWPKHKFGCSRLPAKLKPAKIKHTPKLCSEEGRVIDAVVACVESWENAGLMEVTKEDRADPEVDFNFQQQLFTKQFFNLAALRLAPEFDYPVYNGHRPTSPYTFTHHLVQLIRLVLLHTIPTMSDRDHHELRRVLDPRAHPQTVIHFSNRPYGIPPPERDFKFVGEARTVPDKILAVPGELSQDEYLSLPILMKLGLGWDEGEPIKELGARWQALTILQCEAGKSRLLAEWDCDRQVTG